MNNTPNSSSLNKKRKVFGWLLVFSIILLSISIAAFYIFSNKTETITKTVQMDGPPIEIKIEVPAGDTTESKLSIVVACVSLLTSITSLVGFISTTILAWRKDRREATVAEIDIRKKELEIERDKIQVSKNE